MVHGLYSDVCFACWNAGRLLPGNSPAELQEICTVLAAQWSRPGHAEAAQREGWGLALVPTGSGQALRVTVPDEAPATPAPAAAIEAWTLVRIGLDKHHFAAREMLARFNPLEHGCITLGAAPGWTALEWQ